MTPVFIDIMQQLMRGIGATVSITAIALLVGGVLGIPLAVARASSNPVARAAAAAWVNLVRGIPPLVWLLIVFLGVGQLVRGLSAFTAGVLVFSLVASAFFCEIYVGGIRGVPKGQYEAAAAVALPRAYTFGAIVLPQALRISTPAMASYAIGLLKDSALVSVIGVQDITFFAGRIQAQTGDGLLPFLLAGLLYVALSIPLAVLGRVVASRLHTITMKGA